MSKKAELHYDGKSYQIPVLEGTENEKALDISRLRAESGLITLDKGFKNTGSTRKRDYFLKRRRRNSSLQRLYAIEDLAEKIEFYRGCISIDLW